jgi:heptosyltransferase I
VKILLVKLSSLGDVVHTLPVVQDILAALPEAQVDWVVETSFAPLLSLLVAGADGAASGRGLHRVIPCEMRRWRKSLLAASTRQAWNAFKADLRREAYDAVIDLQGLTKSAVVARLARLAPGGKRYALANQTDGSGYEAPTRWLADVAIPMTPHIHAVQRSRELAAQALGYSLPALPDFGLKGPAAQSLIAPAALEKIANQVVFVHGTSRADKEWPLGHWVALGLRLDTAGHALALAHGNARELAFSQSIAAGLAAAGARRAPTLWPVLSLDALTVQLAQCAGVIGVDSGVSHIAVALGLPHVQIYNFDTAWRTGPDAPGPQQVSVFASPAPSVEAVWGAWQACWQAAEAVAA